jgi:hypothetical protein
MTLQENIDLTPWDFIKSCTLKELLEDEFVDGVFEIYFGEHSLFIKITNIERLTHSESLLFCLNAATTRRSEKNPPFFSGDGLSNSLNMSLISFSDPATHISGVNLGWYIGTHKWLTFQSDIQNCIERISQKLEKKVVMFGGSGGGFASIALSLKMNTDATIVAMNPQTNIIEYPTSRIYLHSAFPHNGNPPERFTLEDKAKWHTFLRKKELIGKMNKEDLNPLCRYIILQSWNDKHHFNNHISNIISNVADFTLSKFYRVSGNISCLFGPWGKEHSVVWREHIELVINLAMQQTSSSEIIGTLSGTFLPSNPVSETEKSLIHFPPKVWNPNIVDSQEVLVGNDFTSVFVSEKNAEYMLKLGPIHSLLRPEHHSLGVFAVLSFLESWLEFSLENQKMSDLNWRTDIVNERIKVLYYLVGEIEIRSAMKNHVEFIFKVITYHLDKIDNETRTLAFSKDTNQMIESLKNQLSNLL